MAGSSSYLLTILLCVVAVLEELVTVVDDIIYVEDEATPKPAPVPTDNNVIPGVF